MAGTNGKGSTCAMLESIYRAAGLRVGLVHLAAPGRFRRAHPGQPPAHPGAGRRRGWSSELQPSLHQFPAEEHPTFFEVVTVMALRLFRRATCDLVIWETGLGGRLDATNIVTPLASVITNIQFDHQKWLGETLTSIALEKAGIIKPGVPVLTAAEEPEALRVITDRAKALGSPLTVLPVAQVQDPFLEGVRLPLLGEHQRLNASLAVATVRRLGALIPVTEPQIKLGLESVQWAGRLQVCTRQRDRRSCLMAPTTSPGCAPWFWLSGSIFPGQKATVILGILDDKDWSEMCRLLAPLGNRLLLVPVHSDRTAQPHGLATICAQANPAAEILECLSVDQALQTADHDSLVVIAGSLYLVGEAMEALGLSHTSPNERALNEWGSAAALPRR